MTDASDPVTLMLTGALPAVVLTGALIAAPAALALLALYRRAVQRGMRASAGVAVAPPSVPPAANAPGRPLGFTALDAALLRSAASADGRWRAAGLYALAVAVFAALMTAAWLAATRDAAAGVVKLAILFWTHFWPAVLVANLVAATDRRTSRGVVAGYFAVYLSIAAVALARSPELTVVQLAQHWLVTNAPPTLLLYAFLARRIRAVGPVVLAFALLAVLGAYVAVAVLGAGEARLRVAISIGSALGLSGTAVFWATMTIGFVLFALVAWRVLRWLGARYAARRLSDEMLTVDAMVLLFGITQSLGLVFEHWAWIASGVVAFMGFRLAARAGYRWLPKAAAPKRLLLLRVFALGPRSEPLFDALRKRWLRGGGIAMIAGPDLATSSVEPDEFLGFLSGELGRRFVAGEADLAARVAALGRGADPDGRFRVDEFFCRADTWQSTMQHLVAESDAVLMDLRSFSAANAGCVYELGRLLDAIDLARVVFVIDGSTDRAFLQATLLRLWSGLAVHSPNRDAAAPAARLMEVRGPSAAETRALVRHLAGG